MLHTPGEHSLRPQSLEGFGRGGQEVPAYKIGSSLTMTVYVQPSTDAALRAHGEAEAEEVDDIGVPGDVEIAGQAQRYRFGSACASSSAFVTA